MLNFNALSANPTATHLQHLTPPQSALSSKANKFSIQGISFIKHLFDDADKAHYTENFNNRFIALGYRTGETTYISAGTLLNSYGEECAIIGLNKTWYSFDKKVDIIGGYSYVGPILNAFSTCYNASHGANPFTGWRPFVFHGVSIKVVSELRLNIGYLLGGMGIVFFEYRF